MSGNLTKEDVEYMSKPENYFIAKFNGLFISQSELFENRTPEKQAIREQELRIIINDVLEYANSIPVEKRVSPKMAGDSNKIKWFMELALKMRETGYSDASIYSIDTDAWDEYRVDNKLTPEQAITEEESND